MNVVSNNFGRIGYVKVLPYGREDTPANWIRFEGLDIRFDISKPIGAVCMDATISILGMSHDHIRMLTTWAADAVAFAKPNRIQVWAGYTNNVFCIFDGSIIYAIPTMPPDVWLNINARSGYYRCAIVKTGDVSLLESDLKPFPKWVKDMCTFIGIDYDTTAIDEITDTVTFKAYIGTVTLQEVIYDLKRECDKRNCIMIESVQTSGKSKFDFKKRYTTTSSSPYVISKDTGMIGVPKITWNEIEVTTLLNGIGEGLRGNFIDVYSRFAMPGLFDKNGNKRDIDDINIYHAEYRVNNVRYHGHLRGDEWYVTYKAWRNFTKDDEKVPEVTI